MYMTRLLAALTLGGWAVGVEGWKGSTTHLFNLFGLKLGLQGVGLDLLHDRGVDVVLVIVPAAAAQAAGW
jgi:hypothetical protein